MHYIELYRTSEKSYNFVMPEMLQALTSILIVNDCI